MNPRDTFAVIGGNDAHKVLAANQRYATRLGPVPTPFGLSGPLYRVRTGDAHFLFLPRHGDAGYEVAAPWVNYRANIYALKERGVSRIMAWSGPGAVEVTLEVGQYVMPSDLIDDTRGRESSFFKGTGLGFLRQSPVFCPQMRRAASLVLDRLGLKHRDHGTYACTQGPRLETPAEVKRLRSWGAHLVGMTLAPEVFLARELEICYLPICYVANVAEGIRERPARPGELFEGLIERAEKEAVQGAVARYLEIAGQLSRTLPDDRDCPCAHAMDPYRREGRVEEDWHTWIGKP